MGTEVREAALRARDAARVLALATRKDKDAALTAMAEALVAGTDRIVAANADDVAQARAEGTPENVIDRLALDADRVAAFAQGVRDIAALPDPIGEVVRGSTLPNGLQLQQIRVPMGVIGMIYEGRPNVTADAAAICLKAGSASLLRGSRSARRSNAVIVEIMRDAVASAGLPADAIVAISAEDRSTSTDLMTARGLVDLVIPRGGAGLIRTVVEQSTVPVIETGTGNVHVYVDADADLDMALDIVVNSKTQRNSVCNAAESLLVHRVVADEFLPRVVKELQHRGVTIHGDEAFQRLRRRRRGHRRRLRHRVPRRADLGEGGRLGRRGDRPRPPVQLGPHRGHRHALAGGRPSLHDGGRLGRRHGERVHPVHRRRRVRIRCRDRHLHAEAARPRTDGTDRDDHHDLRGDRHRSDALIDCRPCSI